MNRSKKQKRGREGFSSTVRENPSRPLLQAASVSTPATPPWLWPLLAAAAACVPFFHGLSLTKVFYVRDLATFFWPRHLWIREGLLAGRLPLWDPAAAAGQPTFPDALNQFFLPPVALLRVLLPPVVAFNVIVVLPFPLAALGAWLFLRGRFTQMSATLGAVVFAASGAVVSTSNFPNLSWSIAWLPWLFWALDRDRAAGSARSFTVLSGLIALQILSGEPVTMAGTLALLAAYVVVGEASPSSGARLRAVARFAGAVAVAAIVSAVQLVPMVAAAQQSARGQMPPDNFWSMHPLWLFEAVLPHVFGHSFFGYNQQVPWLRPMNSGRDPFFYSLYVGPIVLLLSVLGTLTGKRRWGGFWLAVVIVAVVLSFGAYTPVYPLMQQFVPGVRSFRFPVKFFLFASFGLAMLAAAAADSLQARPGSRGAVSPWAVKTMIVVGLAGVCGLVILVGLVIVAPYTGARFFHDLAQSAGLKDPVAGAEFMFNSVPPVASRELILLATAALLAYLGWAGQRAAGVARILLFALTMIEVVIVNADLNPAMPATQVSAPSWIAAMAAHPSDRFYFGGKFDGSLVDGDPDLPQGVQPPRGFSIEEGRAVMTSNLVMTPAAWGVRELLSYDLPLLWPIEHRKAEALFQTTTDRAARVRFLSRGGVRYCAAGSPMTPGDQPIQQVSDAFGSMAVYECNRDVRRAFVVANTEVIPDHSKQLARLFEESFDANSTVMLERTAPAAAGAPSAPEPASARITRDDAQDMEIDVAAPTDGGYLVLLDSFDPRWRVEVDGQPAPLLRANGLFRAVHIAPGRHSVRMHFRPAVFYASAGVSALTALMLCAAAIRKPGGVSP